MLFSVVDDRSGVSYQEYHCVYGEDAESALRFLYSAMAVKPHTAFPFQGRPKLIYLDNGPVAKSRVFQNVMQALDIEWQTHIPAGKDGNRTTARSKGKVERPFRTIKEAHETLYHFHKPETEKQANEWLMRYLIRHGAGHEHSPRGAFQRGGRGFEKRLERIRQFHRGLWKRKTNFDNRSPRLIHGMSLTASSRGGVESSWKRIGGPQ